MSTAKWVNSRPSQAALLISTKTCKNDCYLLPGT
jgi:hypothetical protein